MKPGNLKHFAAGLRSATKFGVTPEYRRRYRKMRREGVDELTAAEMALRAAVADVNPRAALGVTLSMREGQS
jgi:hypothetical protein